MRLTIFTTYANVTACFRAALLELFIITTFKVFLISHKTKT